jgi:hypothetical protein
METTGAGRRGQAMRDRDTVLQNAAEGTADMVGSKVIRSIAESPAAAILALRAHVWAVDAFLVLCGLAVVVLAVVLATSIAGI